MVQTLLAYFLVAAAALYAVWKFMPAVLRSRLAARVGALMRSCGLAPDSSARLEANLNRGGACAGCDSCKACGSDRGAIEPAVVPMVQGATRPPEA